MTGFKKATRLKIKLRGAIFGPSGSGKTLTSFKILKGMGCKQLGVIDSERESALRYAENPILDADFLHLDLKNKTIAGYIKALQEAKEAGIDGLIVDSTSHAWRELLMEVDKMARQQFKGNSHMAWSKGTPEQNKFIDAILSYPGHLICTMRSKTEWTIEKDDRGKTKISRVGLKPDQGKDIEYEFDYLFEMDQDHIVTVIKDRTGMFQDEVIEKPGEEFGERLAKWLNSGKVPEKIEPKPKKSIKVQVLEYVSKVKVKEDWAKIKTEMQKDRELVEVWNEVTSILAETYKRWIENRPPSNPTPMNDAEIKTAQAELAAESKAGLNEEEVNDRRLNG